MGLLGHPNRNSNDHPQCVHETHNHHRTVVGSGADQEEGSAIPMLFLCVRIF
jgi:hypothetical protein